MGGTNLFHKTTLIHPEGPGIRVDVELAELVTALWGQGVKPLDFCKDRQNKGRAWLYMAPSSLVRLQQLLGDRNLVEIGYRGPEDRKRVHRRYDVWFSLEDVPALLAAIREEESRTYTRKERLQRWAHTLRKEHLAR